MFGKKGLNSRNTAYKENSRAKKYEVTRQNTERRRYSKGNKASKNILKCAEGMKAQLEGSHQWNSNGLRGRGRPGPPDERYEKYENYKMEG